MKDGYDSIAYFIPTGKCFFIRDVKFCRENDLLCISTYAVWYCVSLTFNEGSFVLLLMIRIKLKTKDVYSFLYVKSRVSNRTLFRGLLCAMQAL